ncbi:hypothetical protein IAR55_001141 [Kwoniella newhampshirensis]|uniref:Uncharacterized protein n=1 Tax=Kwoniella newhampshirensis TaxID=1651941 RepID=A0AAW0Z4V2_9TREE
MSSSLWISDASPLFFYSPASAYFAGQNLAGWTGQDGTSASGVAGIPSTYHTTRGIASVILPSIYAKTFSPIFTTPDNYNISLQVNTEPALPWTSGQNWTSPRQDFNPQTFQLDVICEDGQDGDCADFVLEGAWIGTELTPSGAPMDSVTLDDSSPLVQYTGFAPVGTNNEIVQVTSADYDHTLSMTSAEGATAQITFTGASLSISGVTAPSLSTYTVTLDNHTTATFDANNSVTAHNTLLYFVSNLDTTATHTLMLESGGGLVIDSFTANGPKGGVGFGGNINGTATTLGPGSATATSANSNGTPLGNNGPATSGGSPNAGVIVGAVLGTIAGLGITAYIIRRHITRQPKKDPEKKVSPWDEANLLQNMKNEEVHVTTAANQRYVYPGLIAHSDLKKK